MTGQNKYPALLAAYRQLQSEHQKLLQRKKKKAQFSQKVCVFGLILVTFAWVANFLLLWFGREPMSEVTIAIITCFGGFATGGYFTLSGIRDYSKNKYGVKED